MPGPLDKVDDQKPAGAEVKGGHDWFNDGHELSALTGPGAASMAGKKHDAPSISANADGSEIAKTLKHGIQKFDYSTLLQGDNRVVFFGERHDDLSQKNEIIAHLSDLKEKNGLTHVALEMLNDADMPSVNSYFAGTGSRDAVLARLKERWSVAPGVPEKYMEMIDAAKSAGLIPLALDQVSSGRDDNRDTLFQDRNEHWAEVVSHTLKSNPKAKVLVYSGRDHVGYGGQHDHANEILKSEFGFDSTVVMLSSNIDTAQTLSGRVAKAAQAAGLNSRQFALQLPSASLERPADIVLHKPD